LNIQLDDIIPCLQLNPCLNGVLAFVTPSMEKIDDILRLPLACVSGELCNTNEIAIYDISQKSLQCYNVSN